MRSAPHLVSSHRIRNAVRPLEYRLQCQSGQAIAASSILLGSEEGAMRSLLLAVISGSALLSASCGNSAGLHAVHGKVLVKGEPAIGATVTFIRQGSDPLKDPPLQGIVEEDGTFTLKGPGGSGAPAGDYVVLVEWKEGAGSQGGRAPALSAPDRLKKKYLDPSKPLLAARVEATATTLPPFELD
jgi:hypothetical protein